MGTTAIRHHETSLDAFFGAREADPAIRLLAQTTRALRADANYLREEDDAAAGGRLVHGAPAGLAEDALARALSRIDDAEALDRRAAENAEDRDARAAELAALPSPLREAAFEALEKRRWRFGGFGIRRLPLLAGEDAQAELLRVEPGSGAARHDHDGDELTLVITGAYRDSQGLYRKGDLALAEPGFTHAPRAEPGEVCYLLAVTYGPARFSGRIGLLQRLTGFPRSPRLERRQGRAGATDRRIADTE
jgi:putative transcriptional regulator